MIPKWINQNLHHLFNLNSQYMEEIVQLGEMHHTIDQRLQLIIHKIILPIVNKKTTQSVAVINKNIN